MQIQGLAEPFHHTDRNTLTKVGEPSPNPLAMRIQGRYTRRFPTLENALRPFKLRSLQPTTR